MRLEIKEYIAAGICLILLFSLVSVTYAETWNIEYIYASPLRVEEPKVVFHEGTVGTSIIYMNNTSAKISVQSPMGLKYGYIFKSSNVRVQTSSNSPVDDSEAILNINLERASPVLIIYNAGNRHGSTESYYGKGCAINIDGLDVAYSWQSPCSANYANSVTVIYATNLTAGPHTIKGRFFSNYAGSTVGIDTRHIAVFWFQNITVYGIRSTTSCSTRSIGPVDDPYAIITFNLSVDSVAFIIYNAGNRHGSTESVRGKGITINIDGADIHVMQWQSPYDTNCANSLTIIWVEELGAGQHTIKGRFFSNRANSQTTIDERQLIVVCFPANLFLYYGFVWSTTTVSTNSGTPVNDSEALLSINLAWDSVALAMYLGGNPHNALETLAGKGVQLQVDGVDRVESVSWQSPHSANYANSATSLWCGDLPAGSHVIRGRFFSNSARSTVTISHRQLVLLAFPKPAKYNYVLRVENKDVESWRIRLRTFSQVNIGRLLDCTISFSDDYRASEQIIVSDGVYLQEYGEWLDIGSLDTIYISMVVLARDAGLSKIYAYLEVLVPNTSTYNLMTLEFELS
ncbi:MAG: hypothetical protein QXT67_03515 [Candidatus Bathyarchaeia archaeon]